MAKKILGIFKNFYPNLFSNYLFDEIKFFFHRLLKISHLKKQHDLP